ncbi:hypothetical protein K461DRAFT_72651 [Myriangium duriaei CBS 260.36]|uniref:Protein kinase domain-containing protein n=1 Tax=Myriangium duriaei CBS 260.36 TaxID=1168546 RepID=A0A9P4IVU8_9PEZI|nr:hypothetical protein K461DRAFT_72651 [Myriangium duriaei CBS 260.36]
MEITTKLKRYMVAVHKCCLHGPEYIGSIAQERCVSHYFTTHPLVNATYNGPFRSHQDMVEGIFQHSHSHRCPRYVEWPREIAQGLDTKGYGIRFTQGDLRPKNIIVHRNGDGLDVANY